MLLLLPCSNTMMLDCMRVRVLPAMPPLLPSRSPLLGISGVGESCHDGDSTTENDVCGADFLCAGTGSGSGSGSAAAVTHDDALVSVGTGSEGTVAAGMHVCLRALCT